MTGRVIKLNILAIAFFAASLLWPLFPKVGGSFALKTCYADEPGLEQTAGTESGTLRRYTDISSPYSGAYLFMDLTVEGSSEMRESFSMGSMPPGIGGSRSLDFLDSIFPPLDSELARPAEEAANSPSGSGSGSSSQQGSASSPGDGNAAKGSLPPAQGDSDSKADPLYYAMASLPEWWAVF